MSKTPPRSNPFTAHRWETEISHRIWIPPEISKVASPKACLISGLRGTGKTALLNCLDPLASINHNHWFLNPDDRPENCLGVYINIIAEFTEFLPLQLDGIYSEQKLLLSSDISIHSQWFKSYLIFTCLIKVLNSIDECRIAGILQYNAYDENGFVSGFLFLLRQHFSQEVDLTSAKTILECGSILSKICMSMRINSIRLRPERILRLLEYVDPVKFYRDFCQMISDSAILRGTGISKHIKISLDDVHRFGKNEQGLLNSIIEINTSPITWNLSYVTGGYDPSLSPDSSSPLTHHDVELVDLSYRDNPRNFWRLCQKIYDIRTYSRDTDDHEPHRSNYAKLLGNLNISMLFSDLVDNTSSNAFRERLLKNVEYVAQKLADKSSGLRGARWNTHKINKMNYLYHTYIFNILFAEDKGRFEQFLAIRNPAGVDNYFRQKNIAALVCAANELSRQTPYAGKNALILLADGCIRDFLRILSVLYDSVAEDYRDRKRSLIPFFNLEDGRHIPIDKQTKCFREASRTYLEQVDNATDRIGRTLARIVNGVAELNRMLQSKDKFRALSQPERGAIRLDFSEYMLLDEENTITLIRKALARGQNTGSIRVIEGEFRSHGNISETNEVTFRLHRLIAPIYNFSSRGPQRSVQVPLSDFIILTESVQFDSRHWAEKILKILEEKSANSASDLNQQDLI
ncbi:ORC-CDC6 family AAA ATPase [Methylobacterium sp. SyP6R]|uniref:ORC-CDC6 family AAA ATPase n=1 Tax=Methylobacterium sp. SyP6R TaxID=2718876 RepID=UPI001F162C5E|nr:hypothetical protein [Methylobacterium sp. SyP6R]MCF4128474.1 hypothetical protein [Methylobacterium sp. SyP6R]